MGDFLSWQLMTYFKTRSHSLADAKRKPLPSVEKRYTSVVYSLRTYYIRFTHQTSVHCDFIRLKCFELHKTFYTDELSAVYDGNLQHIRATNGPWPLTFDKRLWYPFCFPLASSQLTSAASENGEREEK